MDFFSFSQDFLSTPVTLTQLQTYNGPDPIVTRIKELTTSGFKLTMQEEENIRTGGHTTETVGYIAIEPGKGTNNGIKYEIGRTSDAVTNEWYTIHFDQSFNQDPIFLAWMETTDGEDTAGVRYKDLHSGEVKIFIEEETSKDKEISHTTERIGYFVFEHEGLIISEKEEEWTYYPNGGDKYKYKNGWSYVEAYAQPKGKTEPGIAGSYAETNLQGEAKAKSYLFLECKVDRDFTADITFNGWYEPMWFAWGYQGWWAGYLQISWYIIDFTSQESLKAPFKRHDVEPPISMFHFRKDFAPCVYNYAFKANHVYHIGVYLETYTKAFGIAAGYINCANDAKGYPCKWSLGPIKIKTS